MNSDNTPKASGRSIQSARPGGCLTRIRTSRGFTILEVLIAITISMLLMLSLTRAFAYLADRIKENRVRVEMNSRTSTINQLIRDDIRKLTVSLEPHSRETGNEGYFVYYEGPATDVTSVMLGAQPATTSGNVYFADSRFGDFDDYLAFTAYSPETPFRGVVPKYILLEKQDETDGDSNGDSDPNDFDIRNLSAAGLQDALEPVVIYSNYAEIIYWVEPRYSTDTGPDGLGNTSTVYSYDTMGNVVIDDADSNGFPDQLVLHRRVLLIRPDLNSGVSAASPALPGTAIVPGTLPQLSLPVTGGNYVFMQPDPWPNENTGLPLPHVIRTGAGQINQTTRTWQIGMAPIHQQCDLSVRWVIDPTTGAPTTRVAANSLADLTLPHNRFAHVRAPAAALGFTSPPFSGFTTMPILAVGSQLPYIARGLPANAGDPAGTDITFCPSAGITNPTPTDIQSSFNGFLRPEFALGGDFTHTEVPTAFWGRERLGEDILTTTVLGFDLQGYDQLALVAVDSGPDGAPGAAGADDDGDGTTDNASELGSANTDDLVVTPGDPFFFEVSRQASTSIGVSRRGTYVDLGYERLAGGTVRSFGALLGTMSSTATQAVPAAGRDTKFLSQLSLFRLVSPGANLPFEFLRSGKLVRDAALNVRLCQPTYDTFCQDYEFDGYPQQDLQSALQLGTVWFFPDPALANLTDLGADGLDRTVGNPFILGHVGVDDITEAETAAPFSEPLSAFRIRLRLTDENSGTTTQQTVTSNSDF